MKKPWEKKEIRDSKDYGGRRNIRSGGIWFNPGDVTTEDFLIENKTTQYNSFSIKTKTWKKIRNESWKNNKMPCLSVMLGDGTELIVLDKNDFDTFFEKEE